MSTMPPAHHLDLPSGASSFSMPPLLRGSASLAAAAAPLDWLWQGYLARSSLTILTSQWKAGKTTLASILLARMKTGGQLAGLPLAAGRAVVVSEEGPEHWQRRHELLDLGDHIGWYCRPFLGKPRLDQWLAFVDGLAELHAQDPYDLLLIDPLAAFLPGSENHAGSMLEALTPLQRLTSRRLSVLTMHHPSKGDPPIGQAARGSGALTGFADIVIEMRSSPKGRLGDRRRRLSA
jgi:AAA domain